MWYICGLSVGWQVSEAISRCHEAGVRVVMVTGDSKPTAMSIGKSCGIYKPSGIATARASHYPTHVNLGCAPYICNLNHTGLIYCRFYCATDMPVLLIAAVADGSNGRGNYNISYVPSHDADRSRSCSPSGVAIEAVVFRKLFDVATVAQFGTRY